MPYLKSLFDFTYFCPKLQLMVAEEWCWKHYVCR